MHFFSRIFPLFFLRPFPLAGKLILYVPGQIACLLQDPVGLLGVYSSGEVEADPEEEGDDHGGKDGLPEEEKEKGEYEGGHGEDQPVFSGHVKGSPSDEADQGSDHSAEAPAKAFTGLFPGVPRGPALSASAF